MADHAPPPSLFFLRGPAPWVQAILYALLAVALMVVDAQHHYLKGLRDLVSVAVYPLQRLAHAPGEMTTRASEFFVSHARLTRENRLLREAQMNQTVQLQKLELLERENRHLRELLDLPAHPHYRTLAVEILHMPRDPFSLMVLINHGMAAGIRDGMPVVDDRGVVGQVTRVFPVTAEVRLVTDKGQMVPVEVVRTGQRAILFGSGRADTLQLPYLPVNADLVTGDILITSGIDGVYPRGLAVARVERIERNAAFAFADITCVPLAGIDRHRQLLVLAPEATPAPPPPSSGPGATEEP